MHPLTSLIVSSLLLAYSDCLTVDCGLVTSSKMSCRCFGFNRDSEGQQDLGDLVSRLEGCLDLGKFIFDHQMVEFCNYSFYK